MVWSLVSEGSAGGANSSFSSNTPELQLAQSSIDGLSASHVDDSLGFLLASEPLTYTSSQRSIEQRRESKLGIHTAGHGWNPSIGWIALDWVR